VGSAAAQSGTTGPSTGTSNDELDGCLDSGFYTKGKFITDLCWTCFFPMRIFGITVSSGSRGQSKLPDGTASPMCVCPGRTFGIPSLGITWGMWKPTHTIELVRQPWCSPILFGQKLGKERTRESQGISVAALQGGNTHGSEDKGAYGGFYNFHWITFPVGELINMLTNKLCTKPNKDMDYLYLTEFDPTWSNELLALYTHPEVKLFTKVYAHAVCIADAISATLSKPIEKAWWCGGTWGMVYPYAGKPGSRGNPEGQFLAAARGLAAMHRRGLAKKTYGNKSVCKNSNYFFLPKHQYQYQNLFPLPRKNNAEWLGASSFTWGSWRNMPARGEDRVIVQWTYEECCITFW